MVVVVAVVLVVVGGGVVTAVVELEVDVLVLSVTLTVGPSQTPHEIRQFANM